MSDDVTRTSLLNGLKLRALVRDHVGADPDAVADAEEFAPGAALVHEGAAWILLDERPEMRLGAAAVWAHRRDVASVQVIAERATGLLARRAAEFEPELVVWFADGRVLLPAVAEPREPPPALPEHHEMFRSLITEAGADPSVEHGVLVGEVRGLEVCRVVDDPHLGTTRLEVGVGAHDREAFQMLHGDVPAAESLARIVEVVAEHRRAGAPQHPLNRLAAERFVRWRVLDDPSLVGARRARAAQPPVARSNLKDPVPCVADGVDEADRALAIVCSSGVDLDLVPFAADARAALEATDGVERELVIALPGRDRLPVVEALGARLRRAPRFVSIG